MLPQVAIGAISEADRHSIRGEHISVDTIRQGGEQPLADAVRACGRLPRMKDLVLAGALMGGDIARAVREVRAQGLIVVSLNMAGSVPAAADLVVTDPLQGTQALSPERFRQPSVVCCPRSGIAQRFACSIYEQKKGRVGNPALEPCFCRSENFGHFRIRVGTLDRCQPTFPHLREDVGVTVVKLQPTSPFIPDRYDGTIRIWKSDVES
jgi:hypothetical protein